MFGAAKSDFEPHAVDFTCKQLAEIGRRRVAEIERELRQQCAEKGRLPRLECVTLAAAKKRACWLFSTVTVLLRGGVSR
jgi:hypothetical protein